MRQKEAEGREGRSNRYDSSKADDRPWGGRRVVWCNGHNGGGAGYRPRGENRVRDTDVTHIAGDGQKVERPGGENRAWRDDMIGEIVCL